MTIGRDRCRGRNPLTIQPEPCRQISPPPSPRQTPVWQPHMPRSASQAHGCSASEGLEVLLASVGLASGVRVPYARGEVWRLFIALVLRDEIDLGSSALKIGGAEGYVCADRHTGNG